MSSHLVNCNIHFSRCYRDLFYKIAVGLNGIEPSTSRLSGVRSNRLSYKPSNRRPGFRIRPNRLKGTEIEQRKGRWQPLPFGSNMHFRLVGFLLLAASGFRLPRLLSRLSIERR